MHIPNDGVTIVTQTRHACRLLVNTACHLGSKGDHRTLLGSVQFKSRVTRLRKRSYNPCAVIPKWSRHTFEWAITKKIDDIQSQQVCNTHLRWSRASFLAKLKSRWKTERDLHAINNTQFTAKERPLHKNDSAFVHMFGSWYSQLAESHRDLLQWVLCGLRRTPSRHESSDNIAAITPEQNEHKKNRVHEIWNMSQLRLHLS